MLQGYKTLIGILIALLGQVLGMLGIDLGDVGQLTETVTMTVDNLITLAGLAMTLYGRVQADGPIGGGS